MIADLHVHTTFSDGLLTPEQIVDLAVKKNLNGIAITDHDTILGIDRAIKRSYIYKDFYIIPGIEFSCTYKKEEIHILGYFINYKISSILKLTEKLKRERINRSYKMIKKLNNLGFDISINDVKKFAGKDFIGRPHIARALIEKGFVKNMSEAFNFYLNIDKPAYVERYKLSIDDTVKMIHSINGLAVLAHPGLIQNKETIEYCIHKDIDGIEVIHSKHSEDDVIKYINLANKYHLIKTGGSDCHGQIVNGDYLLGKYYVNINNIPEMKGRLSYGYLQG